ncbi:MAG TPA: hypothetical protein VK630_13240 [Reyranella sp.]|nr:hypothetical protein [Reyranella sp.]
MTTNAMTPVLALVAKLPASNPIRKAYEAALEIQSDYVARGKLAWKSRRAAKSASKRIVANGRKAAPKAKTVSK